MIHDTDWEISGALKRAMVHISLLICAIFTLPVGAQSWEVVVVKPFPAYKVQKAEKKQRLKMFRKGEKAFISSKKYGSWRKLLITLEDGSVVKGWAHVNHMKGRARLQKVEEEHTENFMQDLEGQLGLPAVDEEEKTRSWQQTGGIGASLHISHLSWGERTFTLSDETNWTVSEVTSTNFWPSIFVDLVMGSRSAIRFYVGYRVANFEGESTTDFIGTKQTSFEYTFLSLGLAYKLYQPRRKWWWGLGAEGAQGQKLTIAYDNEEIPVSKEDLPLFILIFANGGYDMELTDSLFLLPELRLGVVYNQDPRVIYADAVVSIGWRM